MAAILQFRQGSKSSFISSGPYISEPFFDTDTNIIHIGVSGSSTITLTKLEDINSGSFSVSGDISGSNLYLTGDITASNTLLSGDITIGGNIILGDSVTDDITISGQLDSDLIPKTDNTHDLGSTTKKWANLHVVSGSIDSIDLISNLPSGVISGSSQLPIGIISGSSQLPSGIISGSEQLPSSIVSSSQQVIDFLPTDVVSGSTQVINFLPTDVVSGSTQVINFLPSGVISGSSEVEITQLSQINDTLFLQGTETWSSTDSLLITPFAVDKRFDTKGVISGSSQVEITQLSQINDTLFLQGTETWSSTDSLLITPFAVDKRLDSKGLISGSSQITPLLPSGTVSGSSQILELTHLHSFTSSYNNAISLNGDDVTIIGDLTVQGTQTQLNTATLNIEDKNLLIASGAADSSAANGAGITIDGANKSLEWEHGTSQFVFDAQVSSSVGFKGDGSQLEFPNTNIVSSSQQVIDFLPSGTVSGSTQITDGSGIVSSSNQIDTGSIHFQRGVELYSINGINPASGIIGSADSLGVKIRGLSADGLSFDGPGNLIIDTGSDYFVSGAQEASLLGLPQGTVSGSDQVTQSLDLRYLEIDGDNVLSSSNENFLDYSQSVDLRLLNTLSSGSETSQSLHTLVGNFPTSGSLGTSAFYNVSSSLYDDPDSVPTVKAVFDYINNTIGAADITGVSASLGLSGGGDGGYVSLSLDTASAHFQAGVELYGTSQVEVVNILNDNNVISSSIQLNGENLNLGIITGSDILSTGNVFADGYIQSEDGLYVGINGGQTQFSVNQTGNTVIRGTLEIGSAVSGITDVSASISSIDVLNTTQNSRLDSLESLSSSLDSNVSTSEILIKNTDGTFTGSNSYADSNNLAVGTSTPSNLGATQLTINDSNTAGTSGLISFTDSDVVKSYDYVTNNYRYVDTNAGVGIVLKPDADSTKSWVIDTDGDLVSNGGSWASGNIYANNLIASSSITASYILVDEDITANNFIGNIQATNGIISGSSQLTGSLVDISSDQTINGTKTFNDIVVNGTGSFAYLESVQGSAKIIGDAFIILNNDTPTERYAGISVYDSGSANTTASFQFDGSTNDWFYEYDDGAIDYGVVMFGPEYSTKGAPTYLTNNRIPKGDGGHHLNDSNISDDGSTITLNSDTTVNGVLSATTFAGMISGSDQILGGTGILSSSNETFSEFSSSVASDFSGLSTDYNDLQNIPSGLVSSSYALSLTGSDASKYDISHGEQIRFTTSTGLAVSVNEGTNEITWALDENLGSNSNFQDGVKDKLNAETVISGSTFTSPSQGNLDAVINGNTQSIDLGLQTTDDVTFGSIDVTDGSVDIRNTSPTLIIRNTDTTVIENQVLGEIKFLHSDADGGFAEVGIIKSVATEIFTGVDADSYKINIDSNTIVNGTFEATGDIIAYASSDRRLKEEISPISNPIEKINQIGGYSFVWNTEKQHIYKGKDYGVIAQEIEEVLPELVQNRENGYKAVKYDKLVSLLIEGIKELSQEVKELKEKINRE